MTTRYTVFEGQNFLVNGPLNTVVREINSRAPSERSEAILVFDDATGRQTDVDLRDTDGNAQAETRTKGRPRLGVVSREVTLLPRHWDWLRAQPGGASAVLRKLVDQARHSDQRGNAAKQAQNSAYAFIYAIAGNLPGFEETTRALFAGDESRFKQELASWPQDIARYAHSLAGKAFEQIPRCLE
jgi:hypothetical protein